jgi:cadmium resistance protein CadD (predicted permease)
VHAACRFADKKESREWVNTTFGDPLASDLLTSCNLSAPLLAIAAFVSTNVDDLFLLGSLFVDAEFRTISIVVGQFLGMSLLVAVSILATVFTVTIPAEWIGFLGVAPLLLGIDRLWKLFFRRPGSNLTTGNRSDFVGKENFRFGWARSEAVLVTLLTLANGGDNLSVYIPLFSVHRTLIPLYALVFGVMTALWCYLGYYLTSHRRFGTTVKRYGRFIVPFVLIGIGLNVLTQRHDVRRRDEKGLGYVHSRHFPKNSSECRMSENPYRFSILRSTFSTGQESIIKVTRPHSVQMIWS